MSLLMIDACPRGRGVSRTLELLDAFAEAFSGEAQYLSLASLDIKPYDGEMVAKREALIDAGKLDDPIFYLARQFAEADQILIAAPYWDLSFPSILKVYIEHIFARTITFVYDESGPIGLCRARRMGYITTSGSPIGENNLGGSYIRAAALMLGIPEFDQVSTEGLDIEGADEQSIMLAGCERARNLAASFSDN